MTTFERRLLTRSALAALAILGICGTLAAGGLKLVGITPAPAPILLLASPFALVGLIVLALFAIGYLAAAAGAEHDL